MRFEVTTTELMKHFPWGYIGISEEITASIFGAISRNSIL
jgi:hypothetical protein